MRTFLLSACVVSSTLFGICALFFLSGLLGQTDHRKLPAATGVLTVFVDNPDVPGNPPPDTGGGSGGSSGGGGGGGGAGGLAINTIPPPAACMSALKGDFNKDCKVDLLDFSILAYWYKRPLTAAAYAQGVDLNNDKKVDLVDFSILAYYWNR